MREWEETVLGLSTSPSPIIRPYSSPLLRVLGWREETQVPQVLQPQLTSPLVLSRSGEQEQEEEEVSTQPQHLVLVVTVVQEDQAP